MDKTVFSIGAGPPDLYPEVRAALTRPAPLQSDPGFLADYERINAMATRALRASEPALILQAEAILGIEATAASLIGKSDVVLNLASGPYGKGFGYWAARYCGALLEIEVPYDEAIDPAQVKAKLDQRPDITVVAAVHHETPTGHAQSDPRDRRRDPGPRGAPDRRRGPRSFGAMDVHPEDFGCDVFIAGPGKCLGGTGGLTLMALSARAWDHIETNPDAPFASILSLKDWRKAHLADQPFPSTPLVSEVNGLEAALDRYFAEGPERVWRRHALTARACRAGAEAMGLSLWPKSHEIAAPSVTAVRLPEGLDAEALVDEVQRRYGVLLSACTGDQAGRMIRIGHMGPTAEPMCAVFA